MGTGAIIAKRFLKAAEHKWILTPSGCLMIKGNKSPQLFALNENYVLVWLSLHSKMTFNDLRKVTKLNNKRLLQILRELESKKLIQALG